MLAKMLIGLLLLVNGSNCMSEGYDVATTPSRDSTIFVGNQRYVFLPPHMLMTIQGSYFNDVWIDLNEDTYKLYKNLIIEAMRRKL